MQIKLTFFIVKKIIDHQLLGTLLCDKKIIT